MTRLFNLYGGKKGYLDYKEAKIFVRDVLIVCELLDELEDSDAIIDGIVQELDPHGANKVYLSELLKPSWGKVQDVLHTVSGKMSVLAKGINSQTDTNSNPLIPFPPPTTTLLPSVKEKKGDDSSLSISEIEENCPPSFICPISTEIMTDPVILVETGTTYDRIYIQEWLQNHDSDPSTGLKLNSKEILPVLALKNAIEEWTDTLKSKQKDKKERREKRSLEQLKIESEESMLGSQTKEKESLTTYTNSAKDAGSESSVNGEKEKSEIDVELSSSNVANVYGEDD